MVPSLLIMLREGIEVALIIGIIAAYLKAIDKREWMGQVWLGMFAALGLSIVAGIVANITLSEISGDNIGKAIEAVAALAAVGVLTYMIFWMRRQARHIKGELHSKIDKAVAIGSPLALVTLAFVSVGREAFETVLFMIPVIKESGLQQPAIGALLGIAISGALGYGIYKGGIKLDLRKFFNYTSLLLIFVAAGLLMTGVHELIELGLLPSLMKEVWNTSAFLPHKVEVARGARDIIGPFAKAVFGYRSTPALAEIGSYLLYLSLALYYHFRPDITAVRSRRPVGNETKSHAEA